MEQQRKSKTKPDTRPSLKLMPHPGKSPPKLHLGADAPTDDVTPGDYLVTCTNAWVELWRGQWRCVWQFTIVDGRYHGVGVRKFKKFDKSGEISPGSEFARACAIALKRPLGADDDLDDPASIFAGKKFLVFIGYRKSRSAGGGTFSDDLAYEKKGKDDRPKVHEIKSLVEL